MSKAGFAIARAARAVLRGAAPLGRERAGSTAIEFALIGSIFSVALLNVFDVALLIWSQMEIDFAAETGAHAAYKTCSPGNMPATTNCANMMTVITTAAQATSLGTAVSLASGSPSENYYCLSANTLISVGSYSAPPSPYNCDAIGDPSSTPGDYVTVKVTYDYKPVFGGLSVVHAQTLSGTGIHRLR